MAKTTKRVKPIEEVIIDTTPEIEPTEEVKPDTFMIVKLDNSVYVKPEGEVSFPEILLERGLTRSTADDKVNRM